MSIWGFRLGGTIHSCMHSPLCIVRYMKAFKGFMQNWVCCHLLVANTSVLLSFKSFGYGLGLQQAPRAADGLKPPIGVCDPEEVKLVPHVNGVAPAPVSMSAHVATTGNVSVASCRQHVVKAAGKPWPSSALLGRVMLYPVGHTKGVPLGAP